MLLYTVLKADNIYGMLDVHDEKLLSFFSE